MGNSKIAVNCLLTQYSGLAKVPTINEHIQNNESPTCAFPLKTCCTYYTQLVAHVLSTEIYLPTISKKNCQCSSKEDETFSNDLLGSTCFGWARSLHHDIIQLLSILCQPISLPLQHCSVQEHNFFTCMWL